MAKIYDYVLVGQGLAGSALAYHLIERGKSVMVIDNNAKITSSKIAAGLFNPITGRKMVKTWKADVLFPYLKEYYTSLEEKLDAQFLYHMSIYRPFISLEEQNEWMGKSASDEYSHFIVKVHQKQLYDFSKDIYGGVELGFSGYLDIPNYLNAVKNLLISTDSFWEHDFEPAKVKLEPDHVTYEDIMVKKLIFCDGLKSTQNPYFSWLPFRPVKGEIIQMSSNLELNHILNRGVFVIKKGESFYEVGSNYNNKQLDLEPTTEAREEILGKLTDLADFEYDIIHQKAGIRPATLDRRPFIGTHPEFETIGIFNGLGTKGVSLSPYFAKHYVDYLEGEQELIPEVNISRYFSLY
ncbi:NAD(P)/FAD-dependent oxidoreductase [Fulvivirga ligni]|uniref:NAD(P)/FAD-dependent oxidoreductase n=1 Tax=Fulvivirga ligni TaxID=2904246 RepID=UPI001F3D4B9B|nr:FAD-binding oxidoreductase [Fulvivirga ligni]UII21965.1 FAD-binding oxidoreductase [Fulvivirga ligni]